MKSNLVRCFVVGSLLLSLLAGAVPADAASGPRSITSWHDNHDEGGENPGEMKPAPRLGNVPCVGGFADQYPCQGLDLMGFVPLVELYGGGEIIELGAGLWGWTDPQTRREYAVMALYKRIVLVDVTDPAQARVVGYVPSHIDKTTVNREVSVYKDHAFVVADGIGPHGMQVFDLTRLRDTSGSPVRFEPDTHYAEFGAAHTIFIHEATGYAYASAADTCKVPFNTGLQVIDLRDPKNPKHAGCYLEPIDESKTSGYIHDTYCTLYKGPDRRYRGHEICFLSAAERLAIVDFTDKSAPVRLSELSYPGRKFVHQSWITEDHRFLALDDELDEIKNHHNTRTYFVDVSNLTAPKLSFTYTAATAATDHNQVVRGNLLYQGNYRAGLRILDISQLARNQVQEVAFFDVHPESDTPGFDGAWGSYPFFPSGNIAVPSRDRGLFIVRPSQAGGGSTTQPGQPCRPGPATLCLQGNRFAVSANWRNQFDNSSGQAGTRKATDLAGYFSFGDPANLELMVKILDFGSEVKLFYGQLTNLEVTLQVADTRTGQTWTFGQSPGNCGQIVSLGAIGSSSSTAAATLLTPQIFDFARPGRGISASTELRTAPRQETGEHETGKCVPNKNRLCLSHRRYQAELEWKNQFNGTQGVGQAAALSELTGSFAFQDPRNVEVLVKVLEFEEEDKVLVLWGSLSNLEYTLKVTDTETGAVKTYHNPSGTYCGGLDENAF